MRYLSSTKRTLLPSPQNIDQQERSQILSFYANSFESVPFSILRGFFRTLKAWDLWLNAENGNV
jgi:hypothetical protein